MCSCVSVLDIMLNDKCLLCRDYCAFQLPIRINMYFTIYLEVDFFVWAHCTQCIFAVDFFYSHSKKKTRIISTYTFDRLCVISLFCSRYIVLIDAAKIENNSCAL